MKKLVIIPSYNGAKTLESVIQTLPKSLLSNDNKVVIVNDASTDESSEICQLLLNTYSNLVIITHEVNKGYGGALKTGLRYGLDNDFDIFPIVHADGQYAPEMAEKLSNIIADGKAQIVQGSRMLGGARKGDNPMPLSRYIPNKTLTFLENLVFGTNLAEFHSGYMVYSKSLLKKIPFEALQNNYNFDAEMIILANLVGSKCYESPIPTKYDDETSSLNPIPYGLNVLKMMLRYEFGYYRKLIDDFTIDK